MNQRRQSWWRRASTEAGRELRGKGPDASGVTVEFSLIMGAVAIVALLVLWWLS